MIEKELNGGYKGLYAEVVVNDCYGLKTLDFVPEIIYDIGANIGVFTRYARELFSKAHIVAVEPDAANCSALLQYTNMWNVRLIMKAIGSGPMFTNTNALNGSHKTYLSFSEQVNMDGIDEHGNMISVDIPQVMLPDIFCNIEDSLMKIDIEGNENVIWEDKDSLDVLSKVRYLAMEIHPHVLTGRQSEKAKSNFKNFIEFMNRTHDVVINHPIVIAKKKYGIEK